ncbi:hypothetical protein FRC17_006255 [Serendipita sp. 399]|nr:hypothetical protein FRC17_006255 [Serendipita sp. 399]
MAPTRFNASKIRNKMKREEVHRAGKREKKQAKLKRRLLQAEKERKNPEEKIKRLATNVPKTQDNMREFDPSILTANPANSMNEETGEIEQKDPNAEANLDIDNDPFASYFNSDVDPSIPPKVLITTSPQASRATYDFCDELVGVVPGAEFVRRKKGKGFEIGVIAGWAAGREYGAMLVVNEDMKKPSRLLGVLPVEILMSAVDAITLIHLPDGPTAYFKLTSLQLTKEIFGHARATPHHPELILNGFVTRLGHAVGRMFQTLFPRLPEFEGRQVVTLHNQRDFLFFRRHRYAFRSPEKAALQEIGPRFTLKLRWLKKGIPAVHNLGAPPPKLQIAPEDDEKSEAEKATVAPKTDDYEWQWRPDLEDSSCLLSSVFAFDVGPYANSHLDMTSTAPLDEGLAALKLSSQNNEEANPWASTNGNREPEAPVEPLVKAETAPPAVEPIFTQDTTSPIITTNVSSELNSLVDRDGEAAQDAWASSTGHPRSEQARPEVKPEPKSPEVTEHIQEASKTAEPSVTIPPASASALTSTFTNLARTFSRPRSWGNEAPSASAASNVNSRLSGENPRPATPQTPARSDSRARSGEGQFDFQKFLDQLKTRSAEPVAQFLRSFLNHFSKRTFTVSDQVKLVQQFLIFIEPKMRECSVWKKETTEEFENSMEAMEKLVMNRIYDYTFTPQIHASGRPVTTDDLEKDHVLSQRIRLFGWVTETHLDVPVGENNQGFLNFAQQELLKINHYKAPRDKMICVLNCCKVIFGLLRQLKDDQGADAFLPVLILVVLKSNPEHLLSNIEYIQRFRSPGKLQSESGYYLSSLIGAVSFIETMDHSSLSNITQEEFERNVEEAIQTLPPSPRITPATPSTDPIQVYPEPPKTPSAAPAPGEESANALQLPTPASVAEDTKKFLQRTGEFAQQTISKPLNAIGKLLTEALDGIEDDSTHRRGDSGQWNHPDRISQYAQDARTPQRNAPVPIMQAPYKARVRPAASTPSPSTTPSTAPPLPPRREMFPGTYGDLGRSRSPSPEVGPRNLAEEIGAIEDAHRQAARETVSQIFPSVEGEVVDMVLEANGGDLGRTIDAILEMMSNT